MEFARPAKQTDQLKEKLISTAIPTKVNNTYENF